MTAENTEVMNCWPILSKAFWNFCDLYRIDSFSVCKLLQMNEHECLRYQRLDTLPEIAECIEIVKIIMHIHAYLHVIFNKQNNVIHNYFHVKRPWLKEMTILEYILQDNSKILLNLKFVENYLRQTLLC